MFKKLFQKSTPREPKQSPPPQVQRGHLNVADLNPRVVVHYGIPTTSSILAFDPVQSLLAVGTLDGRIKVIGGNGIEGLLISPKQLPFKNLEFLQNQGFLVSVSSENDIQVWDLTHRRLASSIHWESNITAFSVIHYSSYMFIGDEYGAIYVLKYDASEGKLVHLPYQISPELLAEAAGVSLLDQHSVVGVLSQPCSHGNRFVIAYDNGLIILWDVSEDHVVIVRGNRDLRLNGSIVAQYHEGIHHHLSDNTLEEELLDKEISALCWASNDGSVLAVGYVDGDIMLWNLSTAEDHTTEKASQKVVKLQLSSSSRRLPVIILRWSENKLGHDDGGCRIFVYGGDEIGSEEVLTILSVDLSSGMESLKCLSRVDITLNGSFADTILLSSAGEVEDNDLLLILTNPGQLHVCDDACLSALMSQQEKKAPLSAMQYPMTIPTVEPCMTIGKLGLIRQHENLSKKVSANKLQIAHSSTEGISKWPLTGGAHTQLYDPETYPIERVYIAGYHDGSLRIWDATSPLLSLIFVVGSGVQDIKISGLSAPISALDLCSYTSNLAVGNQHGLVCVYSLIESSIESELHIVTENGNEVHKLVHENKPQCLVVFSILSSSVRSLQFAKFGARLVVGFDSGQVAMLDINTPSVLFLTSCVSNSVSPVISLSIKPIQQSDDTRKSPKDFEQNKSMNYVGNEVVIAWNQNGDVLLLDSTSGNVVSSTSIGSKKSSAVQLHILEGSSSFQEAFSEKSVPKISLDNEAKTEHEQAGLHGERTLPQLDVSSKSTGYAEVLLDTAALLCFEDELILCPLESIFQDDNCCHKVVLDKPCCWTTTFRKDEKECGLVVLYKNGVMEIRSLPNLEALQEISLMSILRWSFKTNMEKTICSSDSGQLALVSGCEFAIMSLLACENDLRIPESLPLLHDEDLAAASDSTICLHANEEKKQSSASRFMDNIIKGFQADKSDHNLDSAEVLTKYLAQLETIFSRSPLERILSKSPVLESLGAIKDDREVIELNIDDIEIDEPVNVSSSSMKSDNNNNKAGKETERKRLFEGSTTNAEPRVRTVAEIKAKYKKTGDASSAASQAKDKLMERQEKLEKLSKRTEELQSGAQNFASLANELAKNMEKRKWWNI